MLWDELICGKNIHVDIILNTIAEKYEKITLQLLNLAKKCFSVLNQSLTKSRKIYAIGTQPYILL